jgi:hypothetical protein
MLGLVKVVPRLRSPLRYPQKVRREVRRVEEGRARRRRGRKK